MSSIHLPKAVGQRGKTSLEIDRENFEKRQVSSSNSISTVKDLVFVKVLEIDSNLIR